jgi:hypothetical protein
MAICAQSSKWTGITNVSFKGTFNRRPKNSNINLPLGWFAVQFGHVTSCTPEAGKNLRHKVHGRWFEISSEKGKIIRNIRFAASNQIAFKGHKAKKLICIDWQGWIDLNGRDGTSKLPLKLKIREVNWWAALIALPKHPDPAVRASTYLGLVSLSLGLLSIFLALLAT